MKFQRFANWCTFGEISIGTGKKDFKKQIGGIDMTQEEHIQQTVEKSITAFWDHEKRQSSSIAEFSIRSIAGPESTACVAHALTLTAPRSLSAFAAFVIVPAVSIISSTRIQFFLLCPLLCS